MHHVDETLELIRCFVHCFESIKDLQFEAVPWHLQSHQGIGYLLIVASLNQGAPAEFVRDVVRALYDQVGADLLKLNECSEKLGGASLQTMQQKYPEWKLWPMLDKIIRSATSLIQATEKHGGLVERGLAQNNPVQAVERLSRSIYFMGRDPNGARKKAWMFMRWMVRPAPDVGVWSSLGPEHLRVPLDSNTGRAFLDLQKTPLGDLMQTENVHFELDSQGRMASTSYNVEQSTRIARWIFPNDPVRVDYALFCYGRRFGKGEDAHRCWRIVGCNHCPIKNIIKCAGHPQGVFI